VTVPRITIVCTAKGRHKRHTLGWLTAGGLVQQRVHISAGRVNADASNGVIARMLDLRSTRTLDCPSCSRHIEWRPETAKRIYDMRTAQGGAPIDVSLL
jgi:hypothetical protein